MVRRLVLVRFMTPLLGFAFMVKCRLRKLYRPVTTVSCLSLSLRLYLFLTSVVNGFSPVLNRSPSVYRLICNLMLKLLLFKVSLVRYLLNLVLLIPILLVLNCELFTRILSTLVWTRLRCRLIHICVLRVLWVVVLFMDRVRIIRTIGIVLLVWRSTVCIILMHGVTISCLALALMSIPVRVRLLELSCRLRRWLVRVVRILVRVWRSRSRKIRLSILMKRRVLLILVMLTWLLISGLLSVL